MDPAAASVWSSGPMRAAIKDGNHGEIIRQARQAQGWTQADLGKRCGCSHSVISRLETGEQPLSDIHLIRTLADVLEIPPYLLGITPAKALQPNGQLPIPRPRTDPAPGRVLAQLPPDVSEFAGRELELDQLDALLAPVRKQHKTVVMAAISGMPGVGKSTLAVRWAHRVANRFDGQLYVDLRGTSPSGGVSSADAIRGFLDALEVEPNRIRPDLEYQVGLYRSLLAGKRMLVVLDNVRDTDQIRPLLPGAPGCVVIVTSRTILVDLIAKEGARPIQLSTFTDTEARQLLEQRIGAERIGAEPDAVQEIIGACARLPLALAILAVRPATHPQFSLASLASELRASRSRLDVLSGDGPDTNLRSVFSVSYAQLTTEAQGLFRLLGLHPALDISAAATASLAARPPDQTRTLLDELTRGHLVTEQAPGRYGLHDLLREFANELVREHLTEAQYHAAHHRILDHYLHTAYAADRQLRPIREPITLIPAQLGVTPEAVTGSKQAMAWFVAEYPVLLPILDGAAGSGFLDYVWQLAWVLDTFLDRQGHLNDASAVRRSALDAARRLGYRPAEAWAHRAVARTELELGERGGLEYAHDHLHYALDLSDALGDQAGQANAQAYLGQLHARQNQYAEALDHAAQALVLFQAIDYRVGCARMHNDVGWYHAQLGNHQQAIASCQKALDLHQELGNEEGAADAWDSLAYAHQHLGHLEQAIDCYQRSLALRREHGDRHYEATTLTRLGDTWNAADDQAAARGTWQQALDILEELDHPGADSVREKLASFDQSSGEVSPANDSKP